MRSAFIQTHAKTSCCEIQSLQPSLGKIRISVLFEITKWDGALDFKCCVGTMYFSRSWRIFRLRNLLVFFWVQKNIATLPKFWKYWQSLTRLQSSCNAKIPACCRLAHSLTRFSPISQAQNGDYKVMRTMYTALYLNLHLVRYRIRERKILQSQRLPPSTFSSSIGDKQPWTSRSFLTHNKLWKKGNQEAGLIRNIPTKDSSSRCSTCANSFFSRQEYL